MAGEGISNGANGRPLQDTVSETGPGIPDDAVMDGELGPGELGAGADRAVAELEKRGWAPAKPGASPDASLGASPAAEAESEAHPS